MENKIVNLKKIVLLGPESAGKTALSEKLAAHYQTLFVPEYAREYLQTTGKNYTQNDLLQIARGQMENEDKITGEATRRAFSESNRFFPVFMDTDLHVIKVWSEFVFNSCDNQILNGIVKREYDLYLLCKPDLPWVKDELREYPDQVKRDQLYHYYRDIMVNQPVPWEEISGNYDQRLMQAVTTINRLFQQAPDIRVAI
jgi:NadR type nicotinamide-nucleotide adenylyltransferase